MRGFWVLLGKELRELLTPQTLIPLLAVVVIFGGLGQILGASGDDDGAKPPIVVLDLDGTEFSETVVQALQAAGFEATVVAEGTADDAVAEAAELGADFAVTVPEGFESALRDGIPQTLEAWTVIERFSFAGGGESAKIQGAILALSQQFAALVANEVAPEIDPDFIRRPLQLEEYVVVGGRTAQTNPAVVLGLVTQQTTFVPIVLFIVIVFAAQMIATAIATEKENKTLETLLSYPIGRGALVTAKMVAAALVALLSAGVYMIGLGSYQRGVMTGLTADLPQVAEGANNVLSELGLTFSPGDFALLGLSLFAGILVALAIAVIIGAFADNVKAVQALLTPLMVLLLVPYVLSIFLDLTTADAWLRWLVYAIPFTYPFISAQNLLLDRPEIVWFGIAYQLVWFVVFAAIAARIFSSDRILTMKLSLGRKRANQ